MRERKKIRKPKILIIDDDRSYLNLCNIVFSKVCEVFLVRNLVDAQSMLSEYKFDIVLSDIHLGIRDSGIVFANELKRDFPLVAVSLMTSKIKDNYAELNSGIFCVEKTGDIKAMMSAILNYWLLEKRQKKQFMQKQKSILKQLPFKDCMRVVSRKPIRGVEAIDYRLLRDDFPRYVRSVNYRHPNHPLKISVGVAVMRGCYAKCRTCQTGMVDEHVTEFGMPEMVAQVLYSLESSNAYGYLSDDYEISVEYTCGGDFIYCSRAVCDSIAALYNVSELNYPTFIIPTIGNNKIFEQYLPILTKFPVRIYLSTHSLEKEKREWLLPATTGQSLEKTREILSNFSATVGLNWEAGKKWVLAWMLIKGFNDSAKDLNSIAQFCKGYPIRVKVMLMDGSLAEYPEKIREKEGLLFVEKLRELGVDAYYAVNMGSELELNGIPSNMTCGTTKSTHDIVKYGY